MLSEEEKKAIEFIQEIIDFLGDDDFPLYTTDKNKFLTILDLLEKQQKELNNLKEIEQSHQEENGKLRVELEQEKNKINTIKKIMSIGDVTDEALFTLVQATMAELDRLEDIEEQLDKEKEKNKSLKKQIKEMQEYYKNADFIFKDKIKEKIEQAKQKADDDNLDEYIKISAWKELLEESE